MYILVRTEMNSVIEIDQKIENGVAKTTKFWLNLIIFNIIISVYLYVYQMSYIIILIYLYNEYLIIINN